jgi:surfactin synthase thioesterase subunit
VHDLPEPELIERLRMFSGTPDDVFQHRELLDIVIPRVRADFEVCETYEYHTSPPFACPIRVFGGQQDTEVSVPELKAWQEHTSRSCEVALFPGGHFFLRDSRVQLLAALSAELEQVVPPR